MGNCCGGQEPKSVTGRQFSLGPDSWSDGTHQVSPRSNSDKKLEPELVAFWDYKPSNAAEIELLSGDELVQLEADGQATKEAGKWIFVMRTSRDRIGLGYVHRSLLLHAAGFEDVAWNFGPITRDEAEEILRRLPTGTFLIRARMLTPEEAKFAATFPTVSAHFVEGYVLSVKYHGRECKHYKILRTISHGRPYFGIDGDRRRYKTMRQMVTDLRTGTAEQILCCALKAAAPRPRPVINPLPLSVQETWQQIGRNRVKVKAPLGNVGAKKNPLCMALLERGIEVPKIVVVRQLLSFEDGGVERFLSEAVALKNLGKRSNRFVKLLGAVTSSQPITLVMEYIAAGTLWKYLRIRRRAGQLLPEKTLVDVCAQISDAMRVMEQLSIVHRSLSTQHILVYDADMPTKKENNKDGIKLLVKITGLGLSTSLKQNLDPLKASGGSSILPVRWTPPEVLNNQEATTASDVWTFGITAYEIFTHGNEPYPGVSDDTVRSTYIAQRRSVERDLSIPSKVYDLICRCCKHNPDARLSFSQIHMFLDSYYLNN